MPAIAPYGSWRSPITAAMVAAQSRRFEYVVLDGADTYWSELRPTEGGRLVVVRHTADGRTEDVTPAPFNARTRVHEYGGAAFTISGGTVYFSNYVDQRLYRQRPGQAPEPLTPETQGSAVRYADGTLDRQRNGLICVREDHRAGGEPANTIVALNLDTADPAANAGTVLVSGNDFYSSPVLSPNGTRLAWLTWNHPNMPWDATELWVGSFEPDGSLADLVKVAGGESESIYQPAWSPSGVLHFVSDRSGWWNLYRWREGTDTDPARVEPLCPMEAEFGRPAWQFGSATYGFQDDHHLICAYTQQGLWHLGRLDTQHGRLDPIETPYTELARFMRVTATRAVCDAGSPSEPTSIVQLDLASGELETLRRVADQPADPAYISAPEPIQFLTEGGGGPSGGRAIAHALYYPPKNPDFAAPPGELPPVIVQSHGGPTSAATTSLQLGIQFWTSRGVTVLDVNYGGSTGFGTKYRRRLNGAWGVVDVDDCVNGARNLADQRKVDANRLTISGGSAGGYTTLCALTFRDAFRAGASYYGVSDLEALATDTHKFESRYLDTLIGPYPERRDLYRERSPIHFVDRLSCPVIFFQGLEDRIVPADQAERMVEALARKGVALAYLPFEGEQHGFRRAENIARAHEAHLYFMGKILGFIPADPIEPVPIQNLGGAG